MPTAFLSVDDLAGLSSHYFDHPLLGEFSRLEDQQKLALVERTNERMQSLITQRVVLWNGSGAIPAEFKKATFLVMLAGRQMPENSECLAQALDLLEAAGLIQVAEHTIFAS